MKKSRRHLPFKDNWCIFSLLSLACTLGLLFVDQEDALALIYVCKDSRGRVSFTNVPSLPDCVVFSKKSRSNRSKNGRTRIYDNARYDRDITRVSRRYNVDPHLIKAIIHTESDFNHRAVSKQGAKGLMQLMPATAKELRVQNPFNPKENIDGGARYFRHLLDTFGGNIKLSLAAYNAGPGQVQQAKGIPPIPETVRYVKKVLKKYRAYKAAR